MRSRELLRSVLAYGLAPAAGLITAPILARALGVEGRGQLAAVLQPLTLADAVAVLGVPAAVTYFIASGHEPKAVQRVSVLMVTLTAVVVYLALLAYAPFVAEAQGLSLPWLALIWLSVIPGAFIAVRRSAWAGLRRWGRLDLERSIFALSRVLVILALAVIGAKALLLFAAFPIIAGLAVSTLLLAAPMPRRNSSHEGPNASKLARFSLSASVGTIAGTASARLDQAIMPGLTSSEELGIYAVSVTVAEIPLVVAIVLARNLTSDAASGMPLRDLARRMLLGLSVTAAGAAILALMAQWAIPLIFGDDFVRSATVSYALLTASVMTTATVAIGAVLTGWNVPFLGSIPQIFSVLVVIVLFMLVGDGISAGTAAVVTLLSQGAAVIVAISLLIRTAAGRPRPAT